MYVRVITFDVKHEVLHEQMHDVYQAMIDEIKNKNGFRGSTLVFNDDSQRGMVMTYWLNADCAEQAGLSALHALLPHVHTMLRHPPDVAGYSVLAFDMPAEMEP